MARYRSRWHRMCHKHLQCLLLRRSSASMVAHCKRCTRNCRKVTIASDATTARREAWRRSLSTITVIPILTMPARSASGTTRTLSRSMPSVSLWILRHHRRRPYSRNSRTSSKRRYPMFLRSSKYRAPKKYLTARRKEAKIPRLMRTTWGTELLSTPLIFKSQEKTIRMTIQSSGLSSSWKIRMRRSARSSCSIRCLSVKSSPSSQTPRSSMIICSSLIQTSSLKSFLSKSSRKS